MQVRLLFYPCGTKAGWCSFLNTTPGLRITSSADQLSTIRIWWTQSWARFYDLYPGICPRLILIHHFDWLYPTLEVSVLTTTSPGLQKQQMNLAPDKKFGYWSARFNKNTSFFLPNTFVCHTACDQAMKNVLNLICYLICQSLLITLDKNVCGTSII